jgi:S-formylglutathione hydrolase FrmB
VVAFVADADVIVVMPEGTLAYDTSGEWYPDAVSEALPLPTNGFPGWYSDWLYPQISAPSSTFQARLKTHHTAELRDILIANFRANPAKFAIAGVSMD